MIMVIIANIMTDHVCPDRAMRCILDQVCYRHGSGISPNNMLVCLSSAHALRLISRTGKRVRQCSLQSVTVGGILK